MNAARPLTLFVDAHCLDKGYHGTHTFLRALYRELLEHYPELDIYFGTYDPVLVRAIFPEVNSDRILPYRNVRPSFLRFLFDIPSYIKRYRFDFTHFQYLGVPWRTASRSIVTVHDVLYEDYPGDFPPLYRLARTILFRSSLRRADVKTTVSAYSRDRIAWHYGVPEAEIRIVPNAVENAHFTREEAVARIRRGFGLENFLLCVSRVEPRKNQLLLLNAWRALGLHRRGIPLVFIGTESIPVPGLRERLGSLPPEERSWVRRLEHVAPEDLAAFYGACKVFVYPSRAEGFGIPPLEAALCGAPVLCSRATAMEGFRFFEPYTFDPADPTALKDKLQYMLRYPPGEDFLRGVSEQVGQRYSRQESARTFYSIIKENMKTWKN